MLKIARFFVKVILSITVLLILAITISGIYISVKQKELSQKFVSLIEDEINLNLNYTDINLSIISNFPFASFNFDNLEVKIQNSVKPITILTAKKVSLTINAINLIQGKYNFRNCIVKDGVLNYYQKPIDSLLNQFSNINQDDVSSGSFNLNKFTIKNYQINIYDNKFKNLVNLNIYNALINIYLSDNAVKASIKSELTEVKTGKLILDNTRVLLDLDLDGTGADFNISHIYININKININGSGAYNHTTGNTHIKFFTNTFETNRLTEILKVNFKDIEFSGKSKLSGSIDYNLRLDKLTKLSINHTSEGNLKFSESTIKINNITANTTLTDNFRSQLTSVTKVDFDYKNINAKLTAKVKGINKPIILTEGLLTLKNHKIDFYNKSLNIDATGKVKALISSDDSYESKFKLQDIKGLFNFNVNDITGIERVTCVTGTVALDDNLKINTTGKFDDKPFDLTISQKDILNILNYTCSVNPLIEIKTENIDIDYITKLIDEIPDDNSTKANDNKYTVNIEANNLRYMDYNYTKVKSTMLFSNEVFEIQNFSGIGFDGTIKGSLKNIDNLYYINTDFDNLNISKLFNHYKDFDQTIVSHSNISGNLSGNAILKFSTTEKGEISYPSLQLESDVTISNGKLIGMNKIDKLSKWLKLDQVKSIDFKTLHNRIEISNQCVRIPKMDVFSNVINMELSGEHYFAGNYTYWMKINFSQVLSRRFLNSSSISDTENTSNGAINLYLKLTGDSNDYEVSLDKKSSFEKVKGNLNAEGNTIKEILKEEYKQIVKKDTTANSVKDSTLRNKTKFNIEWDEYDTLNVDNN